MIFGGQIIVNATPDHGMDRFKELAVTQGGRGSKPIKLVEARGAGSYFPGGFSIDHTFVLFLGSLCKMGAIFCRAGFKIKLILMGVLNQQLAGIGDVMILGWLLFASFESLLFAKFERRGCELPVDQLARGR